MRLSFRIRLVLLNTLVVASLLFALGAVLVQTTRNGVLDSTDRELLGASRRFINGPPLPERPDQFRGPGPQRGPEPDGPAFFRRQNGELVPFGQAAALDPDALLRVQVGKPSWSIVSREEIRYRVLTMARGGPERVEIFQIGRDLTEYERLVNTQSHLVLILSPIAVLAAGLAGWFLANRALEPVAAVSRTASSITEDKLDTRLEVAGDDELARLAQAFNAMLDRLELSFTQRRALTDQIQEALERQRQFTADASHELRTPLTRIKLTTSAALAQAESREEWFEALRSADREATEMSGLIERLLELARAESNPLSAVRTSAMAGVRRAIELLGGDHRIQLETTGDFEVPLPEDDLARAIRNILENAMHHSPPSATVTLTVAGQKIAVRDTGPGIAPEHLPHLGERFYRVDAARTRADGGTGLGLSIAKAIVERGGGRLRFESELGSGTTAILDFSKKVEN